MSCTSFNPKGFYLKRCGNEDSYKIVNFFKTKSVIGRDENVDINLNTKIVSRKHTLVEFLDGKMFIEDLKSVNGTFLKDTRIVQRTEVDEDDLIGIGCSPSNFDPNARRPEFLIFKALLMDKVVLLDSDDDEAGTEKNTESEDDDELAVNSRVENENKNESICISSDEESPSDIKWKEKLSQAKSPSSKRPSDNLEPSPPIQSSIKVLSSPQYSSSNSINKNGQNVQIRSCEVRLIRLSMEEIEEACSSKLLKKKSNGNVKEKVRIIPCTTKQSKEILPSEKEKTKAVRNCLEKLKNVVDSDSSDDNEQANVMNKAKVIEKRDDLECIKLNSSKIIIRRKSTSTPHETSGENSLPTITNKQKTNRLSLVEPAKSAINNEKIESENERQAKPIPKRRMSICATENINDKLLQSKFATYLPVQIIEARAMPKRRRSTVSVEPKFPKRRQSVSSFQNIFLANNRQKEPQIRRIQVEEFVSANEKERLKKERNEKLRQVAEEKAEEKRKVDLINASEKVERVVVKPKVKLTQKNRGDFLTSLPESTKGSTTTKKPENPRPGPSKSTENNVEDHHESIAMIVSNFRRSHVKRTVKSASVENGICNNLQFYENIESDITIKLNEAESYGVGFYNQIQQTLVKSTLVHESPQEPYPTLDDFVPPKLRSILKFPPTPMKPKKRVQFESDERLTHIRLFYSEREISPEFDVEQLKKTVEETELDFPIPTLKRRPSISYEEYNEKKRRIARRPSVDQEIQPNTSSVEVKKIVQFDDNLSIEDQVIRRILAWNPKWLHLPTNSKPDSFVIKPIQLSYKNLKEYQEILQPIIELELLAKAANSYCKIKKNDKLDWDTMVLDQIYKPSNGMTKLILLKNKTVSKYRQGSFLLFSIRIHDQQQDEKFFGYVTSVTTTIAEQVITVSTTCNNLQMHSAVVVQGIQIMYIRAELKSMIALNNLEESELVKNILNPSTIKPCENYVPGPYVECPIPLISDLQLKIVRQVVREMSTVNGIIAIEGGPGTGKTKIIVASVLQIFTMAKREKRPVPHVLVCAASNSCVNEIATALHPLANVLGIDILRTGNTGKLSESVLPFSLNFQAQTYRGNRSYKQAQQNYVDKANIVLTTINSSSELIDFEKKFDICFVDEASQCTDGEILIPLQLKFKKMVLVGDTKQLQPVVNSQALSGFNYNESLLARISDTFKNEKKKPIFTLKQQFRMHPEIFKFPNEQFYNRMLQNHASERSPQINLKPYLMMNVESEQALTQDTSPYNLSEVRFVSGLAETLSRILPSELSIAIITPYLRQREEIQEHLKIKDRVQIYTIDSAQGLEKDVVILSVTRTRGLGFLVDPRRLNVALTRAKRALFVCGNFSSLQLNDLWQRMIDDAIDRNLYENVITGSFFDEESMIRLLKLNP